MMFDLPAYDYVPDPVVVNALTLLILHADQEQNCSGHSKSGGSPQANLYASVSVGVSALWGRVCRSEPLQLKC